MPISGGKYVAPTWANGSAPALSAAEMQAISDSIALLPVENGGTGVSSINELAALLSPNFANVASGTYIGTGTYGIDNKNKLSFGFEPKFLAVSGGSTGYYIYHFWAVNPQRVSQAAYTPGQTYISYYVVINWESQDSDVSWWSTDSAAYQLNMSGETYYYFAAG